MDGMVQTRVTPGREGEAPAEPNTTCGNTLRLGRSLALPAAKCCLDVGRIEPGPRFSAFAASQCASIGIVRAETFQAAHA